MKGKCLLVWKRKTNVGPGSDFIYSPLVSLQLNLLQRMRLANLILSVPKLGACSETGVFCNLDSQALPEGSWHSLDSSPRTRWMTSLIEENKLDIYHGCIQNLLDKMNPGRIIPLFLWSSPSFIKGKSRTKLLWRSCLRLVQLLPQCLLVFQGCCFQKLSAFNAMGTFPNGNPI